MRSVCLFLFGLIVCACTTDELPRLQRNLLGPDQPAAFVVTDMESTATSPTRATVTIAFTSVYTRLTPQQQTAITGVEVIAGGGIGRFTLPVEATFFTQTNLIRGRRYCAEMRFVTRDEQAASMDFCVTP